MYTLKPEERAVLDAELEAVGKICRDRLNELREFLERRPDLDLSPKVDDATKEIRVRVGTNTVLGITLPIGLNNMITGGAEPKFKIVVVSDNVDTSLYLPLGDGGSRVEYSMESVSERLYKVMDAEHRALHMFGCAY